MCRKTGHFIPNRIDKLLKGKIHHPQFRTFGSHYRKNKIIFICRRKPQNLTPPLSSDGGSGQSPSSTHNGSPPPAVKRPSLNNDKYSSDGGPTSKKQRISHFKKDVVNIDNNRLDFNSCVQLQCDNLKFLNRRRNVLDSRDSANLNPRSREYDVPIRSSSHYR